MTEFDRSLDDFDAYQHTPWGRLRYEQVLHNLTPHLPLRPVHVLDAGGGNGLDAIQLAVAGHHVTVMDSSAVSLEAARTSAASTGVSDRIECLLGDIANSAAVLAGRVFDVVLCHNVIQYLPEPGAVISALVGVLRAGGLLSVLAPNPRCDPLASAVRSGDLDGALRLLDTLVRVSATYDIEYTPRVVDDVVAEFLAAGMNPPLRYGVRAVCDLISDNAAKHDPEFFDTLVRLENTMADRRPYMDIARFFHLIATKPDSAEGTLAEMQRRRVQLDMEDYETRVRTGPCFVCGFLSGTPGFEHEIVYDDGEHVGFVNKYPALPGSVLVVPRRHVQDVVRELTGPQYLALQSAVHTVARAVAAVMNPERVYLFSMGSAHGNAHVHWHIAPLPAGVPYRDQQFRAVTGDNGVLAYTPAEFADLAGRLRAALPETPVLDTDLGPAPSPLPAPVPRKGRLVVIRGNSGSGKTTVAKQLQRRFERGDCVVIPQDVVRREFLRESDVPDGHNIALIRDIAVLGLMRGATVVLEGILTARRYGPMLEQLASRAERACFYAFDLTFEQTLQRHSNRSKAAEFGRDDMRTWYGGWDPLEFVDEVRLDATLGITDIIEAIHADITADSQTLTATTPPATTGNTDTRPRPHPAPGTPIVVRSWGTSHTEHPIATASRLTDLADLPGIGATVAVDGHANGGFLQRLEVSLAARRPDVAVTIHNHGRGGATSRDLVAAIEHADLDQDLALFECGTNDVLRRHQPGRANDAVGIDEFTRNYRAILDTLTARSRRVLCLAAPPVHSAILADAAQINRDLFACNLAARTVARDTGAVFIDPWGTFVSTAALLREHNTSTASASGPWVADGIHLSPIGTELILRSIENTLLDKNILTTLLPRPVRTTNTTEVVIRRARLEDIPAAVKLHVAVADEQRWIGSEPPVDEARTAIGLENLMTATDAAVFVGDIPRTGVVATATVHFVASGVAELTMMIAADHRHRGIGTALLDRVVEWCRTNQAHKLTLRVWPHNLPAIGLYQRAGFDIEGTLRAHYRRRNGELWDAIIMSRLL